MQKQYTPSEVEARFWCCVDKTHVCWIWTGNKTKDGYGYFYANRRFYAHRYSFELHGGVIPDGLLVLHSCPGGDNPSCVNPAHLRTGTDKDNNRDMWERNRVEVSALETAGIDTARPRGMKGMDSRGVLTKEDVLIVQYLRELGFTLKEIAEPFNVTVMTIHNVVAGKSWKEAG